MSINPVQGMGPAAEETLAEANLRRAQAASSAPAAISAQPGSGRLPEQSAPKPQTISFATEMPQDEVEVQRDSEANDEIVIKYMDQSGNVILQVPSSQVLGMVRAIDQDFQREERVRTNASETGSEGDKTHGH